MSRRMTTGYCGVIVIALLLSIFLGSIIGNDYVNLREARGVEIWNKTPDEKDGAYYFTFTLPRGNIGDASIAFQTAHFEIEVMIDDEVVYELHPSDARRNKSTGYRWNVVNLQNRDAGKTMTIKQYSSYKGIHPKTRIYFGDELHIYESVIAENGPRFLLSLLILIVGVVMRIYSGVIAERERQDESLGHFFIFSMLLAVWSLLESPITDLIGIWPVGRMVIDHYALMLMPMAFLLCIRRLFTHKHAFVWQAYLYFNTTVIVVRTILQLFGLVDLKQTLWISQISIILVALIGIIEGARETRGKHVSRMMRISICCIFFIFAATIFELILFQIYDRRSVYAMLGFAVYTVVMSVEMMKRSKKTMERAKEAELYKKLAYTDELTGAYNRTAFQHDMESQMQVDDKTGEVRVNPNTIFMFDLNDLKKCNDNFGHEQGDRYIRMVAKALMDAIGIDGRCYRIGGDEFCAIMPITNQGEIDHKLISVLQEVQSLNKTPFVVPISVAVGYAVYNPEYDKTLEDTMKRADTLMYQNKQVIKRGQRVEKA